MFGMAYTPRFKMGPTLGIAFFFRFSIKFPALVFQTDLDLSNMDSEKNEKQNKKVNQMKPERTITIPILRFLIILIKPSVIYLRNVSSEFYFSINLYGILNSCDYPKNKLNSNVKDQTS